MKKFIFCFLFLGLFSVSLGAILSYFGFLDKGFYNLAIGVLGALASLIGLFSLLRPGITKDDIQKIEYDSFLALKNISDELKTLEQKKIEKDHELTDLEIKKKEMEFLVRKASMSLFLREQCKHYEQKITEHLKSQPEITKYIQDLIDSQEKLRALNEEIEKSPHVDLLKEIITRVQRNTTEFKIKSPFDLIRAIIDPQIMAGEFCSIITASHRK